MAELLSRATADPNRPVAVGVIGTGYWGPNLARNIGVCWRTRLAALCDSDRARLDTIGRQYPAATQYTDSAELFADTTVDAVAIATPVNTHFPLAKAAIEAGKHVLLEKPFTKSSAEGQILIDLAAERGVVLLVDHVYIYSPAVIKLLEIYRRGTIGEILFIDGVRINLGLVREDVNVVWDLAPHDLSIVDALLGREPIGVIATGTGGGPGGHANVAYIHLDYGAGLQVSLHVSWLSPVKIRHLLIGGTGGSIVYNDLNPSEPLKIYERGVTFDNGGEIGVVQISNRRGDVRSPDVGTTEALQNLVTHFALCIREGVAPATGGDHGLRLVRTMEAADLSLARHGEYVPIPSSGV